MAELASGMRRDESTEYAYRSWPADARRLGEIRNEVYRWLAPLAFAEDVEDDVVLAVSEAASNCIEHAYAPATLDGTVELTFWTEPHACASRSLTTVCGGNLPGRPPAAVAASSSCGASWQGF